MSSILEVMLQFVFTTFVCKNGQRIATSNQKMIPQSTIDIPKIFTGSSVTPSNEDTD